MPSGLSPQRTFEQLWWARGCEFVAGVDEVGRGCLAGPVVAAAVMLPRECDLPTVRDSKQLTSDARARCAEQIRALAIAHAVAFVDVATIDRINIRGASLHAFAIAIALLAPAPHAVLLDGRDVAPIALPQQSIVAGDAKELCIAAASVLAKVARDEFMAAQQIEFPEFSFAAHKGYPTPAHQRELLAHGPTILHRRSFAPVAAALHRV